MTVPVVPTSVFLLAENRLLREALARILSKKNDIEVVGSGSYSATVLSDIMTVPPDVLLFNPVDARSDPSFLAALRELSLIHISEPTRLLSISYAVFCLKKKK